MRFFLVIGFCLACSCAFAEKAQRIIALSPHAVELLYAIGAGDRIVGTVEYADYPEAALNIPRIGNYAGLQIEHIAALEPDLIVAWRTGNPAADLAKLESLGLPMFYTSPTSIAEIGNDLIRLGELTGLVESAKAEAASLNAQYGSMKQTYTNKEPVRVFYQMWHDPLRTVGPNSWVESLINDCGGQNIFADAESEYPLVDMESALVKNPEVIIIPHHSGEITGKTNIWSKWPQVEAVKNDRLFTIHGDFVHRFTPRALIGLKQICEAIDSARS